MALIFGCSDPTQVVTIEIRVGPRTIQILNIKVMVVSPNPGG